MLPGEIMRLFQTKILTCVQAESNAQKRNHNRAAYFIVLEYQQLICEALFSYSFTTKATTLKTAMVQDSPQLSPGKKKKKEMSWKNPENV